MKTWPIVAMLLLAAPLLAQDSGGQTPPDKTDKGDSTKGYNEKDKEKEAGPLDFSPNRIGWGLGARIGLGYDTNIFKEDRHEDGAWFGDGRAAAYFGVNIANALQLGIEGKAGGRFHFGQDDAHDANLFSLWGAAFLEHRAQPGGFGGGLRVEGEYEQKQFYEIYGPITRQDDLRRVNFYARTWFDWLPVKWLLLDWGLYGRLTDFTEDELKGNIKIPSNDSWMFGVDFRPELRFWEFLTFGPYILFEYEWFRDQFDIHPDNLTFDDDKLQLLRYEFGARARLRFFTVNQTTAKIYARRQDDSAQGFFRYWTYGLQAQTNFNFYIVRIGGGVDLWTREYDARRVNPAVFTTNSDTVFERFFSFNVEVAVNFFWTIEAGARYRFERRSSLLDNEGYVVHEITAFIGFDW